MIFFFFNGCAVKNPFLGRNCIFKDIFSLKWLCTNKVNGTHDNFFYLFVTHIILESIWSLIPNRIKSKHSNSWDLRDAHMVLILAIDQFEAITERTLSVFVIHGNFRISFLAILKQKCQCLLKKLNFFGYNYACINKKGHVPTTPHGCQILYYYPKLSHTL